MSERATAITPDILVWARTRAGLSLSDVAVYMRKNVDDIAAWEAGTAWPTYNQLEKLAEGLYHRPVALFFLPEPPEEIEPRQEFRTLPGFDINALSMDTRFAIRLARSYQQSLRELTGGVNTAERHLLRDFTIGRFPDIQNVAQRLRDYLGISLIVQKSWRTTADAMAAWRGIIESVGIFVFKRSFKQREISGFCLTDDQFPVIMINNSTAFTRQIFTLFHEVGHLLHGLSSITTVDGQFVERMSGELKTIEIICNKLASEFLLPSDAFPIKEVDQNNIIEFISAAASRFNVSREVILRRVLDLGYIDKRTYRNFVDSWTEETDTERSESGGNYYSTQAAYLGDTFLRLVFSQYRAGILPISELAEHLGVKARNISKLEDKLAGRL